MLFLVFAGDMRLAPKCPEPESCREVRGGRSVSATWNLDVKGTRHIVVFDWNFFGGKREIKVDGAVVNTDSKLLQRESDQSMTIGSEQASVVTRPQAGNPNAFGLEFHPEDRVLTPDSNER